MKVIAKLGCSFGLGSMSHYEADWTSSEAHRITPETKAGDFLGVGYASAPMYAQDDDYIILHTRENPRIDHSCADMGRARYLLSSAY